MNIDFKSFPRRQYIKFAIAATIYLLWVIWLGNYFWLLGLPVIFDMYLSKMVNWTFWKKRNQKNSSIVEWVDALIFALIAVSFINLFLFQNFNIPTSSMEKSLLVGDYLFVSKVSYGPRVPATPLSFPLVQHTLPLTKDKNSFLTWIQNPYRRLAGFNKVKNNDPIVFNYPEGDTVCTKYQSNESFYSLVRRYGRQAVLNNTDAFGKIVVRPVDRRENFIKRCIGTPGDTIEVRHNWVFVNGVAQDSIENMQFTYDILTDGTPINQKKLEAMDVAREDIQFSNGEYILPLSFKKAKEFARFTNVRSVALMETPAGEWDGITFPFTAEFKWNRDNYGPVWIPKKGATVPLTLQNLPLYDRVIHAYEGHDLKVTGGQILIDGKPATSYTFKMDYYWMMGDNRHNSADSRFWGFVPEDHIVGKPKFVYLSMNKDKKFPGNIRWNRVFMKIR
ncbi:MAG: signal peptidase I [Bacteroidales bacterium]|jgi:signal peptidase I